MCGSKIKAKIICSNTVFEDKCIHLKKEPFNNILLVNIMNINSIKFLVLVFVQHYIMSKGLCVIKLN